MNYLRFLEQLHARVRPERYLEIGVRWGDSLSVSRCPSLGIDPAFEISRELHTEVQLFRTTSDEYFARPEPLTPVGGEPFDLAFIDGMHLFEFALRDFINAERHSRPTGLIVFDDVLPRKAAEASRVRETKDWTGDVYPMLAVLRDYRPDIVMMTVDTQPTGLLLLMALDPSSTVLSDHYDEIIAGYRKPDPQPVPQDLMDRTWVQQPQRVLASGVLDVLPDARGHDDPAQTIRDAVAARIGPALDLTKS
ncbi:MAG: class I SAM-dependent methyltransferase [Nocardioidaceae bacterium]|nr:class I SAM-dependent methyltransferase [Nocardioidaceae bacterium]